MNGHGRQTAHYQRRLLCAAQQLRLALSAARLWTLPTIYHYFRAWRNADRWERIHAHLREAARQRAGREAPTSAAIIEPSVREDAAGRIARLRRR